jgi:glycosyltransferase involved in cell wall biosynthesis
MTTTIWLSNEAGTGGSATSQAQHLTYLAKNGVATVLIDETPQYTLAKVPAAERGSIEVLQTPLWTKPAEALKQVQPYFDAAGDLYVVLNNPGLLVKYYRFLAMQRRRRQAKIVNTIHGGMLTMTARRRVLEWAASFLYPQTDGVTYVSAFTRRYWEGRYPWMKRCRAAVVHNGVDLPAGLAPRTPHLPLRVGFVGRLLTEKDPRLFCQVASEAKRRSLPFVFHIVGDGPLSQALQAEYAHAGIKWHGAIHDPALIYSQFDLLLMTSPVENCPYVLLEAKSYGIPTVSPAVGGIPEIVESTRDGILTASRSVDDLLGGIAAASERYQALNLGCLQTRERYAAEDLCRQTWQKRGLPL